mmetsp:Transcript_7793/g.18095  ORF Transcript_7793/g.18095 Transcript_7793/m.18095 type:complete len:103 (+) Transcript_7793:3046-3354(+)
MTSDHRIQRQGLLRTVGQRRAAQRQIVQKQIARLPPQMVTRQHYFARIHPQNRNWQLERPRMGCYQTEIDRRESVLLLADRKEMQQPVAQNHQTQLQVPQKQ